MHSCLIFAYLGPETLLPVTSVVATVVGVVLMFGKNALYLVTGPLRKIMRRAVAKKAPSRPHVLGASKTRSETSASHS